ncbi:hypothetical protein NP233_g6511 [Leucocoprinus birnbaumii]|uniref:HMG domain-containing protein n=1 Tax=Leucocoprinus birnbaumii TaxID=56174 RepID=A0AAD5YPY7_9AGAR|nr:hypothetical protein NP233_g6511 [Leucocoprinus birnbaumii]
MTLGSLRESLKVFPEIPGDINNEIVTTPSHSTYLPYPSLTKRVRNADVKPQAKCSKKNDTVNLQELSLFQENIPDFSGFEDGMLLLQRPTGCAGFDQISKNLCVVQGWDGSKQQAMSTQYHLQFILVGSELKTACQCPKHKCVHQQFIQEYQDECLTMDSQSSYLSDPKVVLFYREMVIDEKYKHIFSVTTNSKSNPMNRTIVTYEGSDTGEGTWMCSKDSKEHICHIGPCTHIKSSRSALSGILGMEISDISVGADLCFTIHHLDQLLAISYLPILPPVWATLPSDSQLYPQPTPIHSIQSNHCFRLSETLTCACSRTQHAVYDPNCPVTQQKATLYTLLGTFPCSIELQACPQCPPQRRSFIGPDLREFGVFNYNNSTFVTHDLLDEYTAVFTTLETPFDSWCKVTNACYCYSQSQFMGQDLFCSCWFSYARLQEYENDFQCPRCGPFPENVIWDGVSLAFG